MIQTFLADQYEMELGQFRAVLGNVPEFEAEHLGHTAAWHAVHIAEWLRFFVLQDLSSSYAALGWEDSAWVGQYTGAPKVSVSAGRGAVMAELERVGSEVVTHLRGLRDDELNAVLVSPAAPGGTRPRLIGLGLHLRHVAYHRGQVRLAAKS